MRQKDGKEWSTGRMFPRGRREGGCEVEQLQVEQHLVVVDDEGLEVVG